MKMLIVALALAGSPARAEPGGVTVRVVLTGLRNAHGLIQACLTADARHFPACEHDPQARRSTIAANPGATLVFRGVPPGDWAVSLFHDENANARLDKTLGIPREGYGFSRDAPVRFGPPKFDAAKVAVGAADLTLTVKVRYLL